MAFPGIQPYVVMVVACRDKGRVVAHSLFELKAKHAAIEVERALNVGNFQVYVPDTGPRMDRDRH